MSEPTFVIQFNGKDIPGLLHTWAGALYGLRYNITDISLATGGSVHTTFLKCQREKTAKDAELSNPYRERLKIQRRLSDEVRTWYQEHHEAHNLADLQEEPTVLVKFDEPEDREPSFQVYLSIEVDDKAGAVANLTDLLLGAYTINSTFSRPQFKSPNRRLLYTQIEHFAPIPTQSGPRPRKKKKEPSPLEEQLYESHTEVDNLLWKHAMELHGELIRGKDKHPEPGTTEDSDRIREKKGIEVCKALNAAQEQWLLSCDDTSKPMSFKAKYAAEVRYAFIVWKCGLLHECLCQPRSNLLLFLEAARCHSTNVPQELPRVETTEPLSDPLIAGPNPSLFGHWLRKSNAGGNRGETHLFIGEHLDKSNPPSIMEALMIQRGRADQSACGPNQMGYFTVSSINGTSYVNWFATVENDFPDLSRKESYAKWVQDGNRGCTILRYSCDKTFLRLWYVKDKETLKRVVIKNNGFKKRNGRIEVARLKRYLEEKGGEELFNSEPEVYKRVSS